jgi:predicted GNAT family N-acyltransferase
MGQATSRGVSVRIRPPQADAEWDAYYDLRWRVLRAPLGQPRGSERDALDRSSWHFAAFSTRGSIVGVGRLAFIDETVGQVGYMGVDEVWRGSGVGATLLRSILACADREGVRRLVVNARTPVRGFYERFGFIVVGDGPVLFEKVHHFRMVREAVIDGSSE